MASDEAPDWLIRLYEEQGATLHRLAVLLGAEEQSGRIVRSALLALHRRGHRLIDPAERVEFLQEHVVHLARAVRPAQQQVTLPEVAEPRQQELLRAIGAMPPRMGELLVVSHYLSVFGPELAGIMRMSVRGCNQKLEIALETLRARVGDPAAVSLPGVLESLSQEATAALRSAARMVQAPGTETLAGELRQLSRTTRFSFGPRSVAALTVLAVAAGLLLALFTRPVSAPTGMPSNEPTALPTAVVSRSLPAQVRAIPVYYVGRQDHKLYRELRDLPSSGNLVRSAVEAVLALVPLDSADYETAWSQGQVLGTTGQGDTLVIDLSADAYEGLEDQAVAERARDQIVYSVSELVADPDLKVKFLSDGGAPPAPFVSEQGFARRGISPMPPLWVTTPRNQARQPAGQISITGVVKPGVGEPLVTIIKSGTQQVMLETTAQTSAKPNAEGWRVWNVTTTLDPGTYEIRASVRVGTPPATTGENKVLEVG